jgi:LysM repeat protein
MSRKMYLFFSMVVAAMLVLSACTRSASTVSKATMTATGPFNVARPTGMSLVQMYGTQTAQALATNKPLSSPNPLTPLPSPTPGGPLNNLTPTLPPTGAPGTPATPTARIVVPTATPGRPATYTLQLGEYAYCLARRFNVNPQELLTANNLAGSETLQAGTVLKIPQTGNPFPGNRALRPHPATYTVSSAEQTIYYVACYYGDPDPTSIAAANNLAPPYALRVGQVLNIP